MFKRAAAGCCLLLLSSPAFTQVPAGSEFRVNSYVTGEQGSARMSTEPDGDFVLVWMSMQDGDDFGVMGRRYDAAGVPRGAEFQVNTYTTGKQGFPAVSVGPRGDFVVVWESVQDGSASSIQGQRFDGAGNRIGVEFAVNTYTTGIQAQLNIARAADGRFVVAWHSPSDGSPSGVAARRFDAAGNGIGNEFVVNTYTTGYQFFSDVAMEADGDFVVVWEDFNNRDGSSAAIFGQRFDASATPLGGEFQVNTYTTGIQRNPSVSMSPTGGFVAAWSSQFGDGDQEGMFARRYDAAGVPIGSDFVVNAYTTGSQDHAHDHISHDAFGNFVVTWQGPGDGSGVGCFAQRFGANGARRGLEFRVNTYTTLDQSQPLVSVDAAGNFTVAWQSMDQDGSQWGVFAQRFGGLIPSAMSVDPAGNGVLEPGEAVTVAPGWRNVNGAAQTFGGTLTEIAGPTGSIHTIPDGAAQYGTVADGVTGTCTDCYTVTADQPLERPILHWDATALERILPDTQGQHKRWVLHVGKSFTDVSTTSPFYRFIETLLHKNVTGGCSPTAYCPAFTTTREQMAVFVLVAKEGTGYAPPACGNGNQMFFDVLHTSPFCRWIEELARRGVVSGCGNGNFCPASSVTREQMAVFVLRTLDADLLPRPCMTPLYADVPATSPFCRWIEELARRGVVTGCGGGNYCPSLPVTREQMGVFLSVTFGLTLYGS